MYTITNSKSDGVILKCNHCLHVERINEFDDKLGSRRTQAAGAMLKHVRSEHDKDLAGKAKPQRVERWL